MNEMSHLVVRATLDRQDAAGAQVRRRDAGGGVAVTGNDGGIKFAVEVGAADARTCNCPFAGLVAWLLRGRGVSLRGGLHGFELRPPRGRLVGLAPRLVEFDDALKGFAQSNLLRLQ